VFSLQGKDASKPEGNWLQLLMVVFKKEYYDISEHPTTPKIMLFEVPFLK
jgi:hypothetical protein